MSKTIVDLLDSRHIQVEVGSMDLHSVIAFYDAECTPVSMNS